MFYLFTLSGIALCAFAAAAVYAALGVSEELDELADARRKQREF
ncbi:MAG TPA: hypothetical protein PLJ74_13075 [Myxococcota bacterium]|nr:hypothetical protein [Myxococcota bacterium]